MKKTKTENHLERTALIDGDFFAFQTAAWAVAAQADVNDLKTRLLDQMDYLIERSFASNAIVALSCSSEDGFRRAAYPLYKINRTGDKPPLLDVAKNMLADGWLTITKPSLEADDILGILATNGKIENPVVVSVDKDLMQIPGYHYNPNKFDFPQYVSPDMGERAFFLQWLMGDVGDGYKGIDKMGPKKADGLLPSLYDWPRVSYIDKIRLIASAYRDHKKEYSMEYCLQMRTCAKILTSSDWPVGASEPTPWAFPKELQWGAETK